MKTSYWNITKDPRLWGRITRHVELFWPGAHKEADSKITSSFQNVLWQTCGHFQIWWVCGQNAVRMNSLFWLVYHMFPCSSRWPIDLALRVFVTPHLTRFILGFRIRRHWNLSFDILSVNQLIKKFSYFSWNPMSALKTYKVSKPARQTLLLLHCLLQLLIYSIQWHFTHRLGASMNERYLSS